MNIHSIGVTKGTELETEVANNFKGETAEVGIYLAMSRQASREGFGEIAEVLKRLAWEEAEHAARFAEMNGVIKPTLKENIEYMLAGEQAANKEKKAASEKAVAEGIEDPADFFNESSKDEARHAKVLEGLLSRYF
ncbi:ferritin-like domain-containing protein [Methanobrevibacter curvatus]|jgi:rubrerythrin|uniref:Reverse rubrerythrin-1 n=1 Tax=Methanobrevibacter curvatus TaxID=49547 RepID=A0A165Z7E2_9EURY|nr:ferritin family protein [Methanobrevibacter curvatus]KZX10348.1 reverse rubrerythrin-1 [Methanobrevibacter curvatus]MDR3063538.1 rubrerythrin family protein [Methanobrevibacter sp.]